MYLIVTRAFPPELGGMQSLMWGLTKEMSKNFMIKVFADYQENHKEFDKKENFSIERVGGIKFLRKIRKAQLINEFLKENKVQGIIADHWKSLELIKTDKKKYCLIHGKEINHPKGSSLNKRTVKILNDVENLVGINQDIFTDIYKKHPNGMLIRILEKLDQDIQVKIRNNPKMLIDFINKESFQDQEEHIKVLIQNAEDQFHRVPKVIQPVLISIKNEINTRVKNLMENN